ncbi:hypothetical protein B0H13DRAFT_1934919 [Mycena leptocephala]|nr:hypothetical protein B0H13DRAFT_1934919 [Mycena leptocephala]
MTKRHWLPFSNVLPLLTLSPACELIWSAGASSLQPGQLYLVYFRNFEQDNWKFKVFPSPSASLSPDQFLQTLVTITLVVDTLGIVGDYICVYLYTITNAGNAEYLATYTGPSHCMASPPACLVFWFKPFLSSDIGAFRSITANSSTRKTLIALFLSFAIIISSTVPPVQFGGLFASDTMTCSRCTPWTPPWRTADVQDPVALWLVTEFAVDAGITLVLLWEFRKARGILTETRSTLDRLTAVTIQSGAAAATLAGAGLISYYINPESNVPVAVLYPLRRVYAITLLLNLNIRKSAKSFSTTGTSSGPATTAGEQELPTFTHWATDDSCAIRPSPEDILKRKEQFLFGPPLMIPVGRR